MYACVFELSVRSLPLLFKLLTGRVTTNMVQWWCLSAELITKVVVVVVMAASTKT